MKKEGNFIEKKIRSGLSLDSTTIINIKLLGSHMKRNGLKLTFVSSEEAFNWKKSCE